MSDTWNTYKTLTHLPTVLSWAGNGVAVHTASLREHQFTVHIDAHCFCLFNTQGAKGTRKWSQWMTLDQASVTAKHTHTNTRPCKHTTDLTCFSSLDAYSTLDQRGRRNTLDNTLKPADKDGVQVNTGHMVSHANTHTLHDGTLTRIT